MDVRYRMKDISQLSCNLCQDFLQMVLPEGWKNTLYNKAKYEVEAKTSHKDKYIAAYEKMRDMGPENYSIKDMDVTFITEILYGWKGLFKLQGTTEKALCQVKEDRNVINHSGGNEEDEELYLIGLLSLCHMQIFVKAVDKENEIDDSQRLAYRRKYSEKINELKEILDRERIELIQRNKDIERDISHILESSNPMDTWIKISGLYIDRYWKLEKNPDYCYQFMVRASDAGISFAHPCAAQYYCFIKKDAVECERRLRLMLNGERQSQPHTVKDIIDMINHFTETGKAGRKAVPEVFGKLIMDIRTDGYEIMEDDNGAYVFDIKKYKEKNAANGTRES